MWQLFKYVQIPAIMLMVDIVLFDNIRGALQVFDIPFVMTAGGPGYASSTFTLYTIKTAFTFSNFGLAATMALSLTACGGSGAYGGKPCIGTLDRDGLAGSVKPKRRQAVRGCACLPGTDGDFFVVWKPDGEEINAKEGRGEV